MTTEDSMSEQNKEIAGRIWEEVWNRGNIGVADQLVAANIVLHDPAQTFEPGLAGFKKHVTEVRAAFPDIHFTVEDMVVEGDNVVSRWSAQGTHRGDFLGVPATGQRVTVTGIVVSHYAGGKNVETWSNWDTLGLLQQLGVVPAKAKGAGR
jgi:steroid delta-isomerase-like uncharacterized protein